MNERIDLLLLNIGKLIKGIEKESDFTNSKAFNTKLKSFIAGINKKNKLNGAKYGLRNPEYSFDWYDLTQLTMGIRVEFEHLTHELSQENFEKSCLIAMHHLEELPTDYYTKLEKMESY